MMYQGPVLGLDGKYQISQKHDRQVWELLFKLLEERMKRGEFTIIDATHQKADQINQYKKLCERYRYRCYVLDFSDVDKDTALVQNLLRPEHKQVPENVILNAYERFKVSPVPGWVTVVKPYEWESVFNYKPTDFNQYDKVHIFGDLQGCWDPLSEYLNVHGNPKENPNEMYIFAGDLVDRGIQNDKVVQWALKMYDQPNVRFVRGNHDDHIENYAFDYPVTSGVFTNSTQPQLEAAGITKKELREFSRKLVQIVYFLHGDKAVLVTHGGLSTLPENLIYIATEQMVKGVGNYKDHIDQLFTDNTSNMWVSPKGQLYTDISQFIVKDKDPVSNIYQVHGHRNIQSFPVQAADRSFNLEGKIEFGGHLRVVIFNKTGAPTTHEIKNNTFKATVGKAQNADTTSSSLLERLRSSKLVQEKKFGDISSFHFTRDVFYDKKWNDTTIEARGLFMNTQTEDIVIRSYNKFFNMNEREETKLHSLENSLQFPIRIYAKSNGFLGLAGFDNASDSVITASKTSLTGPFAEWFTKQLNDHLIAWNLQTEFKDLLKTNNISAVFEVIEPVNDPHIVEYKKPEIILLDFVHRTQNYSKVDFKETQVTANRYGFTCKEKIETISNWQDFLRWYQLHAENEMIREEGYVIEDSAGFMVKIKLPWYNFWKQIRTVKDAVANNRKVDLAKLYTPKHTQVYAFIKTLDPEQLKEMSVIDVRNKYEGKT
jgi:hypothetical protein